MIGYAGNIFSERTKIPESLFMILIGLFIGPIFRVIEPASLRGISGTFATIAIVIILIDSGLDFDVSTLFKKMFDAALFTVVVNLIITFSVGFFVHLVFGWDLLHGLLLGIVSSGTTTVMVQSLLADLKVNKETRHLLVLESILNDTTLIIIAVTLIGLIKENSNDILTSIVSSVQTFIIQLSLGIIFGVVFFFIWLEITKIIPPHRKRNYVFILGLLFIQYGFVEFLGGSGVVSVLVFSLFLGNLSSIMKSLDLKERYYTKEHIKSLKSIKMVQLDFSFFIRTFFFVFLGMITNIDVVTWQLALTAIGIILIMILTRYISVNIISLIDKKYNSHAFLISTMVPRGFVATLLAFLPFNEGIVIPRFPELVLLLIFATSIVSIFGTIIYRTKSEKGNKEKKSEKGKKKSTS